MRFTVSILCVLSCLLFSQCDNSQEQNATELTKIVADMNKKCPQVIDSETRLDGLEFKAPSTLHYNYTLLNLNIQMLDTHQFKLAMWPGLLSTIKVSPEMKSLRDNEVTIEYYYQDKNKQPVYLFRIRPQDYKQ